MRVRTTLIQVLLVILLLAGGVLGMKALVASRSAPQREAREVLGPLVKTVPVQFAEHRVQVRATGTVQASRTTTVVPQVSGRVEFLAPTVLAGGFVDAGQVLMRIETEDYVLALERSRAALAGARYELARVESQARVAREEWRQLALEDAQEPNPLVLFEPQLDNARAAVKAAEAALQQAELDLARTALRAPFNARVLSEQVETGQYLRAGNPVATLIGTDQAEVVVPLPLDELRWLQVPRPGAAASGSAAELQVAAGGRVFTWPARVARSLGEVDPRGGMARIVVEVDDPFGLEGAPQPGRPELSVGLFVEVQLTGRQLQHVAPLPRRVLGADATVWVVDPEGRLHARTVQVARRERDTVWVAAGLEEGQRVLLTRVEGAVEGMRVRPVAGEEAS